MLIDKDQDWDKEFYRLSLKAKGKGLIIRRNQVIKGFRIYFLGDKNNYIYFKSYEKMRSFIYNYGTTNL